jgi:hypothetical protein
MKEEGGRRKEGRKGKEEGRKEGRREGKPGSNPERKTAVGISNSRD